MARQTNYQYRTDPLTFARVLWPHVKFYDKQIDVLYSLVRDDETYVPAANMLGKDFVAGFACVWFFCTRTPCRIVTTSAKDEHLVVLWGEINNFVRTAKYPMSANDGGILLLGDQRIRRVLPNGEMCPKSYIKGMVANDATIAALGGHHIAQTGDGIPRTMVVGDECSSVPDPYYDKFDTWANRKLFIGNTWPCANFFKRGVKGTPGTDDKGGDRPRPFTQEDVRRYRASPLWSQDAGRTPSLRGLSESAPMGYHRRVIKITAEDSPNVKYARIQIARGETPTGVLPEGQFLVPGVKSWEQYTRDRSTMPANRAAVALDAEWYEGADVLLYPDSWLKVSERLAEYLDSHAKWGVPPSDVQADVDDLVRSVLPSPVPRRRRAKGVGIDTAEGGDNTSLCAGDEYGVLELVSSKTPDTNEIFGSAKRFIDYHLGRDNADMVCIDRGGGGKQLADRLRAAGYEVRTVGFGESVTPEPKPQSSQPLDQRVDDREGRYEYVSRRAQMYYRASYWLDPSTHRPYGYAIPRSILHAKTPGKVSLYDQLRAIPRQDDQEGRLKIPPKRKKDKNDKTVTLTDLIGHSPDEADAFVLMVHAMIEPPTTARVGAAYDVKGPRGVRADRPTSYNGLGEDESQTAGGVNLYDD